MNGNMSMGSQIILVYRNQQILINLTQYHSTYESVIYQIIADLEIP